MKILVAIKQVPVQDAAIRVGGDGKWIEDAEIEYEINEPDAYALEEALQLKDQHGGEVIVICAGPERVSQVIREALAKGADRAIHVECDALETYDTLAVAEMLANAARGESADLILTGLQSTDLGLGQTGVIMAALLGIPHATIIMEVNLDGSAIRVKRELEDGWFQFVRLPLPALLTIQSGIRRLRYATLMGIKKAKTKEVRRVAAADLVAQRAPAVALERVYLPQKNKGIQWLEGTPAEAAAKLAEKLKFEVRVI
jgi:electron transfer flavoprotein beta subunit